MSGSARGRTTGWRAAAIFSAAAAVAALTPALAAAQQPDSSEPPTGPAAYLTVLAGRLNVRAEPSLGADVVSVVERGARLCVLRYVDDWAEVRAPRAEGRDERGRGFVSRGFVSESRVSREQLRAMGCGD